MKKTKIVEEVIGLVDRELRSTPKREVLEESGRRLLARLEGRINENLEEERGDNQVPARPGRTAGPKSLGSRIGGAVVLLIGGLGLLAVVLLAIFTFLVALRINLAYSGWLLTALAPVSVLAALPALLLSARGAAGLFGGGSSPEAESISEDRKEKELLGAIERRGEISPARAAMETSLTVAEADRMLSAFTQKGYLVARVGAGNLVYALWAEQGKDHIDEGKDNRYPQG
ncbi:MAG: hypothetical protein WA990_12975 [Rubrobacteraceae bacterium]